MDFSKLRLRPTAKLFQIFIRPTKKQRTLFCLLYERLWWMTLESLYKKFKDWCRQQRHTTAMGVAPLQHGHVPLGISLNIKEGGKL